MLDLGYGNFFFHIPRCGGNYTIRVAKGLRKNGKKVKLKHFGRAHGCPLETNQKPRHSFVTLRPIMDWYRSFYRFRIYKHYGVMEMNPGHALDFFIWQEAGGMVYSFDYFLRKITERYPLGYLTGLFCRFFPFVTDVLWLPDLTNSLPRLLIKWGYDSPIILPPIPKNASPKDIPAQCSKTTERKILNAERALVNYLEEFNGNY